MRTIRGTSLIVIATGDGVVMAADDLVYTLKDGAAVPAERNVRKVFAIGNVLIGTAGTMRARKSGQLIADGETPQTVAIKYKFEDWIIEFIQRQRRASDNDPEAVANALYAEMRETFKPVEVFLEHGDWGDNTPGDRLVNYAIAGYSKSFKNFHLFELGAEYNSEGNGLRYLTPIRHVQKFPQDLRFGEDDSCCEPLRNRSPRLKSENKLGLGALTLLLRYFPTSQRPCKMWLPPPSVL